MKSKTFNIKIAEPCKENWDAMKPEGNGRYCSNCTKVVVNFNAMTDAQIATYLLNQSGSVCGRISKTRTQTPFYYPQKNASPFNFSLLKFSLAGILTFSSLKSFSQTGKNKLENMIKDDSGKNKMKIEKKSITQTGPLTIKLSIKNENGHLLKSAKVKIEIPGFTYEKKGALHAVKFSDSLTTKEILVTVSAPEYQMKYVYLNPSTTDSKQLEITLTKHEMIEMGLMMIEPEIDTTKLK